MNATRKAQYLARARIIKALAHPSRLMIVDELAAQPRCVSDLRKAVGADLSTVSKHLSVLKHAGIVQDDKRGLQVFYHLRCPCVVSFFTCAESVLKTTARDHLKALKGA